MKSPVSAGFIYILLGVIFTFFAIQQVTLHGWGIFVYLLIFIATLDFGTGVKIFYIHYRQKKKKEL